ncbi:bifunctional lysylphosphatidylglycerol flippase/synthetase MprF [Dactylosporangium sp. CA-139066]|uniref:bifunctional lysylphosphatidylglycerol flippase/synthetase MprF n=1 Tax=Dactylosporangium sp. CA-139066 TaxID=3239930 RepID=UPI003D89F1AB
MRAVLLGAAGLLIVTVAPDGPLAVGPAPAAIGLAMAGTARLGPLWRRRLRLVAFAALVMLLLYAGRPAHLAAFLAALAGLALGRLLRRGDPPVAAPPTRPEIRVQLALVVAAGAVGPVVATLIARPEGPLAPLRYIVLALPPALADANAACGDPEELAEQCHAILAQLRDAGLGPLLLSVLPAALLLLAAEGLRRGRRFALRLAVLTNLALAGLAARAFGLVPRPGAPGDLAETVSVLAAVGQPLLVAGLLLACRRHFPLVPARRRYRALWLLGAGGPALAAVAYLVGGCLLRHQFDPAPTPGQLLADLPLRLLPVGYLDLFPPAFVPREAPARVLHGWIGTAAWLALLTAIARTYLGDEPAPAGGDPDRARRLLVEHGGDALSYMVTWRGNSYWFSDDGRTMLAYRVISSVALTLGGPVGDPAARAPALGEYSRYCLERGWTPCFYGITEQCAETLREHGWGLVQVAQESVLPLAGLSFRGRAWQDVRTALNRARRDGIEARWCRFNDTAPEIAAQVRELSDAWVGAKGMPEMGFTLGGLDELRDDEVRCLLAVDREGRVHAVTSWLPVYGGGRVVGWTLDLMRRRPDGFNGVMELLIATAALHCQAEGAQFLSLSGAPLARGTAAAPPSGLAHLLDRLGGALEPIYGFRSLLAFKAKFQPEHRPLLLAYPDPAALPTIGNAVTRAYLPHLTLPQGLRLLSRLLRAARPAEPARRTAGASRGTHGA